LKKDDHILIVFGPDIPDTSGHQLTIHARTSPSVCFCTTWGNQNKCNIHFYSR